MSQRLTLRNLRYTRTGAPSRLTVRMNVCPDDPRIADWANSFEERAWSYGRWWGSTQKIRFCLSDSFSGCLVLPREVAVVEAAKVDGTRLIPRNGWYEFIAPHGDCGSTWNNCGGVNSLWSPPGPCGCGCGCYPMHMDDNGTAVSFASTSSNNQRIRFYATGDSSDVGKKVIVQGKDLNGVWVRTVIDGVVSDGEQVTLASPFVDTTTIWGIGEPTSLIKDPTNYKLLMYGVDATTGDETPLGDYQPTETNPMYRVIKIPHLKGRCGCSSSGGTRTLTAIVSLQHIPVQADTDWLLFQNLIAYGDGVYSEKLREDGNVAAADGYFFGNDRTPQNARGVLRKIDGTGALPLLKAELRKMTGDVTTVNVGQSGFVQPIF